MLRSAWIEYERDRARYLAVAMIYYALVSLVPLLLLLLAALGLLLRFSAIAADAQQQLLLGLDASFGPELAATTKRLLSTLQQESIIATVVSLAAAFLTASKLFGHLRLSFRAIWKHEPLLVSGPPLLALRAKILEKLIALVMVLGGGALLLAALVLLAATQWLGRLLGDLPVAGWLLAALSSWTLAAITFAAMFKLLPPVPVRWRHIWLATLLSAVAWVVAGELLALYGAFFGERRSAYGALGGVLVIMLWMNIVSQALFFGAELCKVVATRATAQIAPAARACGRPARPPQRLSGA